MKRLEPAAIALTAAGAAILLDGYVAPKVSDSRAPQIVVDLAGAALLGLLVAMLFRRAGGSAKG